MMSKESEAEEVARQIARDIAEFRQQFWDNLCTDIENELREIEQDGYDPTEGSGRGPKWAKGA